MVASAEAEARYSPEGENRRQVIPRAWERRLPLGAGLNFRCFDDEGGGVGVKTGGGRGGRESGLEDREAGVSSSLEVSSPLSRLSLESGRGRGDARR